MNSFAAIDLSQLPAPQIVEQIDFELILAERKAYMISLWPIEEQAQIAARLELESEPLTKLLQENAYRETIWRQRVNEASIANLLALAKGPDLDQLAGNFNVQRLVVQEAKPMATPPVARLMESDDSLRERAQMSWEGLSTAGPRQSYIFHARGADGRVADATAESPSPAVAVVTVQALLGDGTAPPYLAWAFSVDRWDSNWSEATKRAAIRSSRYIHAHKGTIGALRRVVEPLGYLIEVVEWWQTVPEGVPGTFALKVGVLDTGITEEMYLELTWLIDDAKPLTRPLIGLAISLESTGTVYVGACVSEGDELSVYPPTQSDIDVSGVYRLSGREHHIDTMDIYP